MNIKVTSATQSPMNKQQWLLTLECGHDKWVASKSRPRRRTQYCADCTIASKSESKGDKTT